jgi:hypothetical protein
MATQLPRGTTLRIIRVAFLTGVLMFGGGAYFITRQADGGIGDGGRELAQPLQLANIGILILAAVGLMIIQRKQAGERDPARRSGLTIAGWAMGEATALFGGVHFLLTGSVTPFLVGLGMMLAAFVVVPIRD